MATATVSKKTKNPSSSNVSTTSDDTEVMESASTSGSPTKKMCIICGSNASSDIKKDENFQAMMQLYWCTLGVDVKPEACRKTSVCRTCFQEVTRYFETNDIIVYFENYFKSLRLNLLRKTLKGLKAWEKDGNPLTRIHQEIKKKYPNKTDIEDPEEDQIKQTLSGYKMECTECYDILDDDDGPGKRKVAIKLRRAGAEDDGNKKGSKISLKDSKGGDDTDDSD